MSRIADSVNFCSKLFLILCASNSITKKFCTKKIKYIRHFASTADAMQMFPGKLRDIGKRIATRPSEQLTWQEGWNIFYDLTTFLFNCSLNMELSVFRWWAYTIDYLFYQDVSCCCLCSIYFVWFSYTTVKRMHNYVPAISRWCVGRHPVDKVMSRVILHNADVATCLRSCRILLKNTGKGTRKMYYMYRRRLMTNSLLLLLDKLLGMYYKFLLQLYFYTISDKYECAGKRTIKFFLTTNF